MKERVKSTIPNILNNWLLFIYITCKVTLAEGNSSLVRTKIYWPGTIGPQQILQAGNLSF